MQLTNYSAIDLRHGTAKVLDDRDHSIRRITTGERMVRASDDPGAMSVASNLDVTNRQRAALRTNLQNTRTYLDAQADALRKVNDVYERMSVVATQSLDVVLSDEDRNALDVEFQELASSLDEMLSDKFNGVRLFNQNVKCGGVQNIGLTDLIHLTNVGHVIRAQSFDGQAPGGTLSFEVNSGTDGEVYRVFLGNKEVFSAGDSFVSGDPTQNYGDVDSNGDPYPALPAGIVSDRWRTSGSASSGDFDKFTVNFGPGKPTTFEIEYGNSNPAGYTPPQFIVPPPGSSRYFNQGANAQGQLAADGGIIQAADLSAASTGTNVTLQVETRSIYQIQNVSFAPEGLDTKVTISENGDTMSLSAKGFSSMSGYDVKTASNAQAALAKLSTESDCILYERFGAVRAEAARLDQRLDELAGNLVQGEAAYGRVADLDYAKEMTKFATNSMQLDVMTSSMGTANRATDVLMPLTTEQFKSAVTQRFQLI